MTALGLATAGTAAAGPQEGTITAAFNPQSSNPGDPVDLNATLTGRKDGFNEPENAVSVAYDSKVLTPISMAPSSSDCSSGRMAADSDPAFDYSYGCSGLAGGKDPLNVTVHFKVAAGAKPGTSTQVLISAVYGKVNTGQTATLPIVAAPPSGVHCPSGDVKIGSSFCAPVKDIIGTFIDLPDFDTYISNIKKGILFPKMSSADRKQFVEELLAHTADSEAQKLIRELKEGPKWAKRGSLIGLFFYVVFKSIADSEGHAS